MHFPSLFSKPKPAPAHVSAQHVVSRPGPTESASLRLAKTYRQRRPSEWEIRACQKEVGWEQLSPNGRLQVQRWLTDLVERCDAAKVTYLFARAIKNDFYVEPELEEQERQLQDQAASASRLTGALVSEQRRVEVLTRQLETLQRAYEGGEKTRDCWMDEPNVNAGADTRAGEVSIAALTLLKLACLSASLALLTAPASWSLARLASIMPVRLGSAGASLSNLGGEPAIRL